MISLYFGTDTYGISETIKEKAAIDTEVIRFNGGNVSELAGNIASQSFFNPKRLFVIQDIFTGLEPKNEIRLFASLENLPADTQIVFIEAKKPNKSKLLDYINKEGEIKEFTDKKGIDLVLFIKEKVTEEGGEIAPLAAERLATYVGPDKWQLTEEIKKLVLYRTTEGEKEPIDTADIDLLVKASFEANIFSLMDAVATKNTRRSTELLNSFLESGENEIYILTMIERQFKNIAMAKFEENVTEGKLTKMAKVHPFVAKKSLQQAKNFEQAEIIEMYRRLADADLKLKSGFEPKQVLLRLLV